MDCPKLSPNARKIFEKITTFYPPDPWHQPQWIAEGKVFDNGWYDLRKAKDRDELIRWYERLIGHFIVESARVARDKKKKLTHSVFSLRVSKRWIELVVLFYELDFQIETLDFVE